MRRRTSASQSAGRSRNSDKGERLIVLSTRNRAVEVPRTKFSNSFPTRTSPPVAPLGRQLIEVPEIPILGTGKLDLRAFEPTRAGEDRPTTPPARAHTKPS